MTVRSPILRLLCAALLGVGAAVLVSCGSTGAGLIPAEDAGPLVRDFQAVEQTASRGHGDCTPTRAALQTTERDFQTLPRSVDSGLRRKLQEGIAHLQTLALELCAQPLGQTTTTGESTAAPAKTTTTPPTSTSPTTSSTTGGTTTPGTTTTSPGTEGGTAPEVEGAGEGNGEEEKEGKGGGGGAAGEAGGGKVHEDNGVGNSGVSGNGGTGPGGH
jgi:hypothetical protein